MSTEGTAPVGTTPIGTPEAPPAPAPAGSIVVGHDGSADADNALHTALGLADELQAPVVIVRAWSIDNAPRPANWEFGYVSSRLEYSDAVRASLIADTDAAVRAFPKVIVDYRVVHSGEPAVSLIEVAREARMLVIGSRGLGGLVGLMLGSVSDRCAGHASCPVLVTRQQRSR
ncbi:MAG: universal stress protein [Cryobacterium sp.]|nr:universal stress protein [Cryobacterium sp.]